MDAQALGCHAQQGTGCPSWSTHWCRPSRAAAHPAFEPLQLRLDKHRSSVSHKKYSFEHVEHSKGNCYSALANTHGWARGGRARMQTSQRRPARSPRSHSPAVPLQNTLSELSRAMGGSTCMNNTQPTSFCKHISIVLSITHESQAKCQIFQEATWAASTKKTTPGLSDSASADRPSSLAHSAISLRLQATMQLGAVRHAALQAGGCCNYCTVLSTPMDEISCAYGT